MNIYDFKRLKTFEAHEDQVLCATFSNNNKYIASSSYKEIKIWKILDYSFHKELNQNKETCKCNNHKMH